MKYLMHHIVIGGLIFTVKSVHPGIEVKDRIRE